MDREALKSSVVERMEALRDEMDGVIDDEIGYEAFQASQSIGTLLREFSGTRVGEVLKDAQFVLDAIGTFVKNENEF